MTIEEARIETISFLQVFINTAGLSLRVEELSFENFQGIVQGESELNWLAYHGHYESPNAFCLGVKLVSQDGLSGASLSIYDDQNGNLHIFLIESFVTEDQQHPLHGHLVQLVIIASTYFLGLIEGSKGAFIVEPAEGLVDFYKTFGFELCSDGGAMYASVEALQQAQIDIAKSLLP
ncbi:MAG: hypothetical protein CENE_03785 [Candidatus Celerinatantimonas neptuna]|nr:MAG: hypothetical protein CENE_03785 [Candidatus Celerinatantimonas neptuna]